MPTTPTYGFPYPAGGPSGDAPNGPAQMAALALAIEATIAAQKAALPQTAQVSAAQSTASAAYTDLATVGPAVTLVTGTTALVILTSGIFSTGAGQISFASFAVSGASTIAASDANSLQHAAVAGIRAAVAVLVTGLTPGSNTFTAKYRAGAGTANFFERGIIVVPF